MGSILDHGPLVKRITFGTFVALLLWWVVLTLVFKSSLIQSNLIWAASYQVVAILGSIWGFLIARSWGGFKSFMGRVILFFALGLMFQSIGQTVFSIYNLFLNVEVPYPSLADIGFLGSMLFYIAATTQLGKVSGAIISIKNLSKKLVALSLPIGMLCISYLMFLKNYSFDTTDPLKIFLDFGYPLGDAIYISFTAVVYLFSKNVLGGLMKNKILFLLAALVMQYIADFNFLYQSANSTWVNGSYGDLLYLLAYTLTAYGIIQLGITLKNIKNS